jgi:hypothetical protein
MVKATMMVKITTTAGTVERYFQGSSLFKTLLVVKEMQT